MFITQKKFNAGWANTVDPAEAQLEQYLYSLLLSHILNTSSSCQG